MPTPPWNSRHNGVLGDTSAMANAADLNQLLGTHAQQNIFQGSLIVGPSQYTYGSGGTPFKVAMNALDFDQPFTMSGTVMGRVQIPILPVGNGADLLVSLCSDNSGAPGTLIQQTRIPASWIYQTSPVVGVPADTPTDPTIEYTNNALATAQFSFLEIGNYQQTPYPTPAVTGISAASSSAYFDPWIVQVGGVNGGAALNTVFTYSYASDGTLGTAIPQINFPQNNDGSSATIIATDAVSGSPVVVNCGGGTSFGGATIASVFTSNLDATSGSLSAWSAQTALPYQVQNHSIASANSYVYVIGGRLNASTGYANVTFGQVQNGQITAWTATTPLPAARTLPFAVVSNGFLFVVGGQDAGITTKYSSAWYAPIHSDGTLGNWITAPSLPNPDIDLNDHAFGNAYGIVCGGPGYTSCLPVTASGPGWAWAQSVDFAGTYPGFADSGNGFIASGSQLSGEQIVYDTCLMGSISVPLPATGLTSGGTYHLLLQQLGGDINNYLILPLSHGVGTSGQSSPRLSYVWTTWPNDGTHIVGSPLTVWSGTPAAVGEMRLHSWEDNGSRITTFVQNTTPDRALIGIMEATAGTTAANANTGFQTSLTPWTCTGGTVVRSNAQAYEGQWSCQVTPSGSASSVYITSELLPCLPGQAIAVSCWLWLTNTATNPHVSLSVTWYTTGGVLISTSSNGTGAGAAFWAQWANTYTAPTGAYQYSIQPTLSGTPPASNTFYVDLAIGGPAYVGQQVASVAQYNYAISTFPQINPLKSTGTTVLA